MPGPIQSIQRASAVLDLLEHSPRPLLLREIVDELGLPKTTVHGILRTLVELQYVDHDEAGAAYVLGARRHGGAAGLDGNVLRSAAMGWCDTLASILEVQVWLAVLDGDAAQAVHHVFRPDDSPQRLRVGERLPLHATSSGKLLLSYSPNRDRLLRNMILESFTTDTILSRQQLADEVATVRATGHAASSGEYEPGIASVAVAVHGPRPGATGALAVGGAPGVLFRTGREPRSQVLSEIRRCASAIARELRDTR